GGDAGGLGVGGGHLAGGQAQPAVGADQQAEGAPEPAPAAGQGGRLVRGGDAEHGHQQALAGRPGQPVGHRDQRRGPGRLDAGQEGEHGGGAVGRGGRTDRGRV